MVNEEIRTLDLFSGIGGFSLGLERAGPFQTVAFCEQDAYAQRVLKKHWPKVPIFEDVRTIPTDGLGRIDIITGGFPCQPWSVAGQQRGAEDDRDLWPEMVRLVEKLRPKFLIGENVRGFINQPMGLKRSLSDLESIGYSAVPFIIPACGVDAPHRRDRVWIIAAQDGSDADGQRPHRAHKYVNRSGQSADGQEREPGSVCEVLARSGNTGKRRAAPSSHAGAQSEPDGTQHEQRILADAKSNDHFKQSGAADGKWKNVSRRSTEVRSKPRRCGEDVADATGEGPYASAADVFWLPEPDVGRVVDGVPNRVDRLKCLGNAVVPQVVEQIGRAILASHE